MHTLPAAKVVGHDFLGNHIGELLFRQPVSKAPKTERTKGSSSGSTVCLSDSRTIRRESVASQHAALVAPSSAKASGDVDALFGLDGTRRSSVSPVDRVVFPDHSSDSSASEPGSVESRSNSADPIVNLHLDQLSLSRQRIASDGGPTSPRISFVTHFGAKPRSAGSRRAPSEAGSSSYFGLSGTLSTASMSPMENPGAVNWNTSFRDQHHSFAHAIEQNAQLNRHPSPQSQASDVDPSLPSEPSTAHNSHAAEIATPTAASTVSTTADAKSRSFSGASQPPVRQRFTRAVTDSNLEPAAQRTQQEPPSRAPEDPSSYSSVGLAASKSMGAASTGLVGHRRKPSLVPKGDDERTFCFVNDSLSEVESNRSVAEEPQAASAPVASVPERSASQSSSKSSSQSSYKEAVEGQYSAHRRFGSAGASSDDGQPRLVAASLNKSKTIARAPATATVPEHAGPVGTPSPQDPARASVSPLRPLSSAGQDGSSRPVRRLRIQPNVQTRPSLLERTMEQQRQASHAAIAANANGVPAEAPRRAAPLTEDEERDPSPGPVAAAAVGERYGPIAYGADQRLFRIRSTGPPTDASAFPFTAMSGDEQAKPTETPASRARTSDWARAQNLLANHAQSVDAPPTIDSSCSSLSTLAGAHASPNGNGHAAQPLLRHHTASHSSTSTESASLLDNRELLSPPETELSTPELESPPEHELLEADDGPPKPAP